MIVAVAGGGRGTGAEIALRLARAGHRVAVGDADPELAAQAARDASREAVGLELDVCDRASWTAFLDGVDERLGPVDALVCAPPGGFAGPFADEPDEEARRHVDLALRGPMLGLKLAAPRMAARGAGHLVAVTPSAVSATAAATRHALRAYCGAVRVEVRGHGVHVGVVMPGGLGSRQATGQEVARAVQRALERPRFEVHVPPLLGAVERLDALLPRGAADALARALAPRRAPSRGSLGPGG